MKAIEVTRIAFLAHDALQGQRPLDAHLMRLILAECADYWERECALRSAAATPEEIDE